MLTIRENTKEDQMANLAEEHPAEFMAVWEGCDRLDCLPKCWIKMQDGHCERLERALADHGARQEHSARNCGWQT